MIKKSFKEIRNFNATVNTYFKRVPEVVNTKLGYAIKKISETEIKKVLEKYQETYQNLFHNELEKKQIDLALTDIKTGAILFTPKGSDRPYQYDKKGLLAIIEVERNFNKLIQKMNEDFDEREFEIESFIVTDVPKNLLENEVEAFSGFVIK